MKNIAKTYRLEFPHLLLEHMLSTTKSQLDFQFFCLRDIEFPPLWRGTSHPRGALLERVEFVEFNCLTKLNLGIIVVAGFCWFSITHCCICDYIHKTMKKCEMAWKTGFMQN